LEGENIMKTSRFIGLLLLISLSLVIATIGFAEEEGHGDEDAHWTYEGEEGPENWGNLDEDYALCGTGSAQSPIDLVESSAIEVDLTNIEFFYGTTALNIHNNGHTIEVKADEGNYIIYNEIRYDLQQFHFHNPSEHTVEGEHAAMEVHFVNKDLITGNLAVVGVLLLESDVDNAYYADIFASLPTEVGDPQPTDVMLDLRALLPERTTYLTYQGSLTTPPCSEIVRWLVLDNTVDLSSAQIAAFGAIFPLNARPVQSENERDLLWDVTE